MTTCENCGQPIDEGAGWLCDGCIEAIEAEQSEDEFSYTLTGQGRKAVAWLLQNDGATQWFVASLKGEA